MDVAATLRADNRELRRKLREAASTLSAAAKERVSSEAERARLRRELRDGEANRRRAEEEWSRREAELVGAKTGALRAKATAEARAKSAERRSERGRKHSEEAEARVAAAERRAKDTNRRAEDAERRAKDANRRAEEAERRAATVEEDLARARDALALMTETAEEARAEAKAMAVWRIEQGPREAAAPAASTPPPAASTPPPAASTPPPRADDETSNRERDTALAEELASLRAALAGELAAARRAEQDSERLRARVVEAESDARAAWFALHAERSRPRDTFPAAPETTPPPGPAAELLALVSPSLLSESDDAVHLAAQATALDKVVSHLNARRMKRTSGGGGVGSNSNGVVFQRDESFSRRARRSFLLLQILAGVGEDAAQSGDALVHRGCVRVRRGARGIVRDVARDAVVVGAVDVAEGRRGRSDVVTVFSRGVHATDRRLRDGSAFRRLLRAVKVIYTYQA